MVDVEAIQELYRYNHWAYDRVFEAVSILTHEEFAKNLGSSHPSVRDTLAHIVSAEWIWLQLRQLAACPVSTDFLVFQDELEARAASGAV